MEPLLRSSEPFREERSLVACCEHIQGGSDCDQILFKEYQRNEIMMMVMRNTKTFFGKIS